MAEDLCSSVDFEEIKELASSMEHDLGFQQWPDEKHGNNSNTCQIHKVHQLVRQIDRFAYEPFVLSIGPYHHGNARLKFMERLKWRCLDYILHLNCTKSMRDYLRVISNMENQARACYAGEIKLDSKSFQRMLLLDGCFILVYLRGAQGVSRITKADPGSSIIPDNGRGTEYAEHTATRSSGKSATQNLDAVHDIELRTVDADQRSSENQDSTSCTESSGVPWYHIFALVDLFLLENQIPFFVVRKLREVLVGSDVENILIETFSNYIVENMKYFIVRFGADKKPHDFCHLLHLCHMHFKPTIGEEISHEQPKFGEYFVDTFCRLFNISRRLREDGCLSHNQQFYYLQGGQVTRWRRATQYYEAGIIFQRKELNEQNSRSSLDVTFHNGVLEIPCLYVDDRTGSLFRNMIAFEQTNPQFGNYVTAYVLFMSQLVSRTEDVTLLSRRRIIVHVLHDDQMVSALFTRLTKGVVFDFMGNFYLRSISWRMEMFYQNRINRWMAWLRHRHLRNPWLGAAMITGLLVLFCTIAQTVLTVLAYEGSP